MPGQRNDRHRYLGFGMCIGVAAGCGLGIVFGNLALGIGPGIAAGAVYGMALDRKHANKPDDGDGENDAGGV